MGATLFGIDVSSYQGTIDWPRVADAGVTFSIARCVLENRKVDDQFARNLAGSRAAGLVPGAYAFLAGGRVAGSMAQTFIDTIGDPTGLLVALDIERPSFHETPRRADVDAFVDAWRSAHPDHPLLLYGSAKAVLSTMGNLADHGPLWMAWYPGGHGFSPDAHYASVGGDTAAQWKHQFGGWTGPAIWQFTSSGVRVPGIADPNGHPRRVDTNAFRGSRADLLGLAGVAVTPVKPLAAQFYTIVAGDTLSAVADRFGFKPAGGLPAYRVMINAFPENSLFAANPGLIKPGQRVRVG